MFYVELPNESDVADISVQKIASFERKLWENTLRRVLGELCTISSIVASTTTQQF